MFTGSPSEHKNEASFQELQLKSTKINAVVLRETASSSTSTAIAGSVASLLGSADRRMPAPVTVPIVDVVLGDRVLLQAGDRVPADGIVIAGKISVDQASLSGEKLPCKKTPHPAYAALSVSGAGSGVPAAPSAAPVSSGNAEADFLSTLPAMTDDEKADFDSQYR